MRKDFLKNADMAEWLGSRPVVTYVLTAAMVSAVYILRGALSPTLGNQALYLFLVPPVLLAGIFGGWGPGLFATGYSIALQILVTGDYRVLIDLGSPLFGVNVARTLTLLFSVFACLGSEATSNKPKLQPRQTRGTPLPVKPISSPFLIPCRRP